MPNYVIVGGRPRLLRIRIKRGINLAVRDARRGSSDPYVVVQMGKQKLKTRVINNNLNPEWNQDLDLSITDYNVPIKLTVYDHDKFTKDDKMGDVEFNIKSYLRAGEAKFNTKSDLGVGEAFNNDLPSSTIKSIVNPIIDPPSSTINSTINPTIDCRFKLKNVECGEVEIQLQWIDLPNSKGS